MSQLQSLAVFCSSSNAVAPKFFAVAEELGALLAARKLTLVYGGGNIGLMGALAQSAKRHGGRVVGVIPRFMVDKELAYREADELLIVETMRERKAVIESRADGFVALPGGWGTLEEVLEALTHKQLQLHAKPVVFLNTDGFYDPLLAMFERLVELRFKKPDHRALYHVAAQPHEAIEAVVNHRPAPPPAKWF
ncbi:MAG: TIGR00730 family Rossman fold protein [Verrucomicrobia bacterium]|nr:TIGR00730 family Rossman fold protein [Verrucomicrobiota bacterium]